MMRKIRISLWALIVVALVGTGWVWLQRNGEVALAPTDLGQGEYRLTQTNGAPFTQDTLVGAPSLVFFGFTHCPDVCPTTLGDVGTWQEELGTDATDLQVFFISVDPDRDSLEILSEYVGWLPSVQGVSGAREEIAKAIRAFRVFARKIPLEGADYTMDHSSSILVFDAKGRLQSTIAYQSPLNEALEKIRLAIGS